MEDFLFESAEGFERLPHATNAVGVYCLLAEGEVVYVGQSKSVYQRIAIHTSAMRRAKASPHFTLGDSRSLGIWFDEVHVRWCDPCDLDRLELYYIDRLNPKWNIQIREPLPKMRVNITELAKRADVKLCSNPPINSFASLLKTPRR